MTFKSLVGVVLLVVTVSVPLFAQPGDPPGPGDNPVPITGIEWLLLGGGALGGYKFFKNKFQKGQ